VHTTAEDVGEDHAAVVGGDRCLGELVAAGDAFHG
jgi:hypothetical protein